MLPPQSTDVSMYQLKITFQNPDRPEHKECLEWHGEFDSEAFDLGEVNRALQGLARR